LRREGTVETIRRLLTQTDATSVFWGIDMDAVREADAPGVSAANPSGLYGEELCQIAGLAGQERRTRLIEITEVNPAFDPDRQTCRLAAVAIFYFLHYRPIEETEC
jgi:formiminoglutamase